MGTNRERPRRNHEKVNRKVQHAFRAPPPRHFKTKEELDDLSSVATAGGSCAGSVSGVSSKWSRPNSRSSNFSYTSNGSNFSLLGTRKELKRTWYSQDRKDSCQNKSKPKFNVLLVKTHSLTCRIHSTCSTIVTQACHKRCLIVLITCIYYYFCGRDSIFCIY